MFDLSIPKLLVLAVIALVVFGPDELPKIAAQAGRALRDLRQIAESAENDLREGLGPELADFKIEDLNPKRFVQKHLNAEQGGQHPAGPGAENGTPLEQSAWPSCRPQPGTSPSGSSAHRAPPRQDSGTELPVARLHLPSAAEACGCHQLGSAYTTLLPS
jgi:sec-independent protein translocase protein TatB